jgi:predicted phosphodiesterase
VFTLAQITDTHFDSYPVVANEIKYLSRLGDIFNFDTLVHSGDITLFHTDTFAGIREFEYFCTKGMDSKAPFFLTHGNHDGNQTLTMELSEVGNIFNYPLMKKGFDVTFCSDDKCYRYIDFKYAKVRIYFLNTTENADGVGSSFGTTQAQWFANSLATVQANWNVVVCAHICPYLPIKAGTSTSGALIPIFNAFVAKTSGTDSSVTFDFTNVPSSVKLAYTLYGHEHFNNYAKSNGVNYIVRQGYNNSASLGNVEDQTNLSMDEWNSTTQKRGEHCLFDIIAIKASGTGKVIRIGVGGSTRDFEFMF